MEARSVASIPEHDLVPLLMGHRILRGMILSAAGATNADRMLFRVPFAALASEERGDVDAIAYTNGAPELSTAFEFKRVKILPHTFTTGTPNKLQEIDKAVRQANALAQVGFNRVLLAIVVVTDGRERTDFNFIFRGASTDLLRTVDSGVDLTDLHPNVGVFRIEVVQPVDKDITLSGGIGGKAYRIPALREQPAH